MKSTSCRIIRSGQRFPELGCRPKRATHDSGQAGEDPRSGDGPVLTRPSAGCTSSRAEAEYDQDRISEPGATAEPGAYVLP
jgi:hypothetical protein